MPKAALTTPATLTMVPTIAPIADVADVAKDESLIYIDLYGDRYRIRVQLKFRSY